MLIIEVAVVGFLLYRFVITFTTDSSWICFALATLVIKLYYVIRDFRFAILLHYVVH
jgi:hypothetical protein